MAEGGDRRVIGIHAENERMPSIPIMLFRIDFSFEYAHNF